MKIFKNKKGGQNAYMEKTDLINFNNAKEIPPEYNGSEKKKTMILNGKKYLVKFPDSNRSSKLNISYIKDIFIDKQEIYTDIFVYFIDILQEK